MNKLKGTITQIQREGAILLVDVDVDGQSFSALLIESATIPVWLQVGSEVSLVFKETEVSLAKGLSGKISMRNRMKGHILKIERGELLSKISIRYGAYTIASAITTRAVDALGLCPDDVVDALIKSNEISIVAR